MTNYELAHRINKAFGESTPSDNAFRSFVEGFAWDAVFDADGEHYYCKGDLTLTAESLDPFDGSRRPEVMILSEYGFTNKPLAWGAF